MRPRRESQTRRHAHGRHRHGTEGRTRERNENGVGTRALGLSDTDTGRRQVPDVCRSPEWWRPHLPLSHLLISPGAGTRAQAAAGADQPEARVHQRLRARRAGPDAQGAHIRAWRRLAAPDPDPEVRPRDCLPPGTPQRPTTVTDTEDNPLLWERPLCAVYTTLPMPRGHALGHLAKHESGGDRGPGQVWAAAGVAGSLVPIPWGQTCPEAESWHLPWLPVAARLEDTSSPDQNL